MLGVDGWWSVVLGAVAGIGLLWLGLMVALLIAKPDDIGMRDVARLLPDVARLLKRLAADSTMPRGIRLRLFLVLAYLALPFDLIPDFVPVLGLADDAIVVALVLRSVVRRAGPDALSAHWPGSPQGLAAVHRLCGLPPRP